MKTTSKTRPVNHRAAIAAMLGAAGLLLGANALAQAPNASGAVPNTTLAALPANDGVPASSPAEDFVAQGTIVATVNDEPITKHDVDERMALFLASTPGLNPNDEARARFRKQILDTLENEMLRLQEARRKTITVSPVEIEEEVQRIAESNGTTKENMEALLARNGANLNTLRNQLKVSIAWRKAVADEYQENVVRSISDADVDAEMARIAAGASKPRFHVAEIFLEVEDPADDERVKAVAENIFDQLRDGANFSAVARQFSQNPSAASGGDIGWVLEGQIAEELMQSLQQMKPGMISPPVRSRGGWYILYLAERQEPAGTQVAESPLLAETQATELPLVRIMLPLGNNPPQEVVENATKFAQQLRLSNPSCGPELKQVIEEQYRSVYMDLGMFKLADLSGDIRQALDSTRSGETAQPIRSPDGIEIFVRCDPHQEVVVPFHMPSRQEVESQIFEDRIAAWARRYERDLKRNADVETR